MDIVTRTILNSTHKYTGTIPLRLCKRSHHTNIVNRTWALNKLRSFPERYKIFLSCRRHQSDTINKTYKGRYEEIYSVRELTQTRLILEKYARDQGTIFSLIEEPVNINFKEISELHRTDWSSKSAVEILHALKLLAFAYSNGTRYEYLFFDSICNACLAKLPELEDNQIKVLLQCLIMLKYTVHSLPIHNRFMKALNKECLKRFYPSTVKQLLLITDAFHQLDNFNSDYIRVVMKDLCTKPQKLSRKEFIQTSYYLYLEKVKECVNIYEMEYHFRDCIQELSGTEIAIIARSLFLNEKGIRDRKVLSAIVEKTIGGIHNMDSLSIAYVMKLIRYSTRSFCPERFKQLLHCLIEELPRLSVPCLTHITHAFGVMHMYNEALTNGIINIVIENMQHARIKDIERIVFGICMVTPFTDYYTDICHKFVNEILTTYRTSRINEVDNYPLSLVRIVLFLTMRNVYVPELLEFIYSPYNLQKVYNIYHENVTNELLTLHYSVTIELPQYKGPLLPPEWYNLLMKKYGSKDDVHKTDRLVSTKSEIVYMCKNKLGVNIFADYIVPYYAQKDLIFGLDEQNNPIDVEFILSGMPQGSIKNVNSDELKAIKWHVIVIIFAPLILDHGGYVGNIHTKFRQLSILGYTPIPIIDTVWKQLLKSGKEYFLRKLIYRDGHCSLAIK